MIVDFHTHIFPEQIRRNREKYFASEPAFELLYRSPKSRLAGARSLVETMDACGVDVSVTFGFPWRNPDTFRRHNDYILEAISRYPGRLAGFCCFDADCAEALPEAIRCLEAGMTGIGELAFYRSGIDPAAMDCLAPLMALCREKGFPLLIHTNEPVGHDYPGKTPVTLEQIFALVARFPENRLVLAHWGGGVFFFHLLKKAVKESLQNVWFDTAASPFLYDPAVFAAAAGIVGAEKILFGSDYPLLKPDRYFREMETCGLPSDQIRKICGLNAAGLLRL